MFRGERVVLRLIAQVDAIFRRSIDSLYHRLPVFVFCFPFSLGLSAISDIIRRFHIGLVFVAALLQALYVRPLIGIVPLGVLFAVDYSGVDPAMHHFVYAVRGTGFVIALKSVYEAAVCNGQGYVPFFRFNFTHAHIAASSRLRQVDAALGNRVDLCAVAIRGIDQIRAGNVDGLLCRTNAAVPAAQADAPAFYSSAAAGLGNIPHCIQGYIPQRRVGRKIVGSILAFERFDFHVPR